MEKRPITLYLTLREAQVLAVWLRTVPRMVDELLQGEPAPASSWAREIDAHDMAALDPVRTGIDTVLKHDFGK